MSGSCFLGVSRWFFAMTPAARLQSAIEILCALETSAQPADHLLREYFRARRYAGSKDRAAVAERVYAILRRRAALAWRMGGDAPRRLAIAALIDDGLAVADIAALFGGGYGPAPLSEAELQAIGMPPADEPPLWVRCGFPAFLETELSRAFGADLPAAMAAMGGRAAIDLRVNTLKSSREDVAAGLVAEGFAVTPTPFSPFGLRLPPGEKAGKLSMSAAFVSGLFEFQDEAAQIAALLCGVKPGMAVLDLAAGAGGKTLALAAMMENRGEIVAHDIAPQRLHQLEVRAARAGVRIVRTTSEPVSGRFDMVLVDAPCSGTGTWRRQPELCWRLTPELLAQRMAVQDALLDQAAGLVRPGGRLVYATCSVLPCENEDRIAGFLNRHSGFEVVAAETAWSGALPPGLAQFFRAAPYRTASDGFFAAILHAPGNS
jgi:16S rRNA (cytosine967-C5)-methyltransferase